MIESTRRPLTTGEKFSKQNFKMEGIKNEDLGCC